MHRQLNQAGQSLIVSQENQNSWWDYILMICFLVGFIRIVKIIVAFLRPFLNRRANLHKRYGGGWALVTGGSQGIGYSIAQQLAKEQFNIILVSRSIPKLQIASQKLKKFNPSIEIIIKSVDFQKMVTKEQYQSAFKQLMQKDISILVNNVGYYLPYSFASISFEQLRRQMKINCLPIAILSRMFIQKMNNRKQKSGIINLSSAASTTSYKGSEHYSATKTFDDYLSRALEYEYSDKIDILTARPFIVTSSMTRNVDNFISTSCQNSAKSIVDSLSKRRIVYGPFIHNIQGLGSEFIFSPIIEYGFTKGLQSFCNAYEKQA